jgi:rRNA-processing protein CGR1
VARGASGYLILDFFFRPDNDSQEINLGFEFLSQSPFSVPGQSKMSAEGATAAVLQGAISQGIRKNGKSSSMLFKPTCILTPLPGKQWHEPKTAFRPKAGSSSFEKRQEERKAMAAVKAKEKEMKDEKEAERQVSLGWYIWH